MKEVLEGGEAEVKAAQQLVIITKKSLRNHLIFVTIIKEQHAGILLWIASLCRLLLCSISVIHNNKQKCY